MLKFNYKPKGVCARDFFLDLDADKVIDVEIIGGCDGNRQAVARLCKGMSIDKVISTLEGIDCKGKGTSCPDQLSKALCEARKQMDTNI